MPAASGHPWGRQRSWCCRSAGLYGPTGRLVRRSILERGEPIPGDPRKFLNLIHIERRGAGGRGRACRDRARSPFTWLATTGPLRARNGWPGGGRACSAHSGELELSPSAGTEAARDATSKRIKNYRMKRGLIETLQYPDITSGLAAAVCARATVVGLRFLKLRQSPVSPAARPAFHVTVRLAIPRPSRSIRGSRPHPNIAEAPSI